MRCIPPCVLALLVDVSTLERGGGGQFPIGHSRMQHPVATAVSSPPLGAARRLLLPRRLRRHQPHLSRSSSPELSHPSNCPSSGGASPMDYLHFTKTSKPSHHLNTEPPALPNRGSTRSASDDPRFRLPRTLRPSPASKEPPNRLQKSYLPPPSKRQDPTFPTNRTGSRRAPGGGRAIPPHRERFSQEEHATEPSA